PIFVKLQTHRTRFDLLFDRPRQARIALAEKAEVDRQLLDRLIHALDVPRAGCARRGVRAGRRTRAAADHRRDARHHRLFDLLRADEMNVRVDAAGRRDQTLSCDDLGTRADHDIDARLHVRIAALADADDAAVLQADVGFDDAPVIEDQGIRDDRVDDLRGAALPLPHAVAD